MDILFYSDVISKEDITVVLNTYGPVISSSAKQSAEKYKIPN